MLASPDRVIVKAAPAKAPVAPLVPDVPAPPVAPTAPDVPLVPTAPLVPEVPEVPGVTMTLKYVVFVGTFPVLERIHTYDEPL